MRKRVDDIYVTLKSMRRGKDYIGVGVGALIFNKKGKILLIRRGLRAKNEVGMWGVPGGTVEFGETLEEAVAREVTEELGITVKPLKVFSMINHIIPKEKQHWVTAGIVCQQISGRPKIQEKGKIDKVKWISPSEVDKIKNVSPPAIQELREFKERYEELEDFF